MSEISEIGKKKHTELILTHARANLAVARNTTKDLSALVGKKGQSGIVISAGPSVHRRKSIRRIKESGYDGTIVAVDASYVACLKEGLIPDFVVTVDPHPTRMVRWFGDHDFETHSANDDYFARQDLDVDFRENSIRQNKNNIELVNKFGRQTKAIVASTAPLNVVQRIKEAGCDTYWWNPLMDDPTKPESLTRKLYELNKFPCLNTGGNVGTSSWVFANMVLKLPKVALVGMDLGYYYDTPLKQTQTYYELAHRLGTEDGIERFFVEHTYPLSGEKFYTDPTYAWYRKNFLELFEKWPDTTYNCTEGGTLFHDRLKCVSLDDFFRIAAR